MTNEELTARLEKTEKALSETMAQVREMDNILAGLLHRVERLDRLSDRPVISGHHAFMQKPAGE